VGMGTAAPAMAASVANAVRDRDLGVATASQQMMAQVGVVSGIQILQTVQQAREPAVGAAASYHWAYRVGAWPACWRCCSPCSCGAPAEPRPSARCRRPGR